MRIAVVILVLLGMAAAVCAVVRYVLLNPVRAGLVLRVGAYPYWNAVWVGRD